jgi:hypothetical protein
MGYICESRYNLFFYLPKNATMNFKEWIIDLFKDERGSTSIKPVIAFVGALFLCATMTMNSFSIADIKPSAELVNAVMVITAIGMGADSLDKFSIKGKTEEKPTDDIVE